MNLQYRRTIKRLFDLLISITGLLILWPVMLIVGLLVHIKLGSPIIFRQQRPGLYGKPFYIYKFRTMLDTTDAEGKPLPDHVRLTPFGKFLRETSLDELPELINVLKGEMSLVGPRPLHMRYLERYTPEQMRRHDVKPGITGWAQIKGRNAITWEKKFELDVWYVEHCSFWLDMQIITLTFWKVLVREGITHNSEATMSEFIGGHS